MKNCLLLYIYKNERDFNLSILNEVYKDAILFSTDRVLALDLSVLEWNDIFPAVTDFNTGQFMITQFRYIELLRFAMINGYEILDIKFYDKIEENTKNLISEILGFTNSNTVNPIIKRKIFSLLKEELECDSIENNNEIASIKIKLNSTEIEFYNCTKLKVNTNILDSDILVLKKMLDSISD